MFAAITRFLLLLGSAVLLYGLTQSIWGEWLSFAISLAVLALPLGYFYIKLSVLKKYLQADEIENLPSAFGYLEDVFFRLQLLSQGQPDAKEENYSYAHPLFWAPFMMVGD